MIQTRFHLTGAQHLAGWSQDITVLALHQFALRSAGMDSYEEMSRAMIRIHKMEMGVLLLANLNFTGHVAKNRQDALKFAAMVTGSGPSTAMTKTPLRTTDAPFVPLITDGLVWISPAQSHVEIKSSFLRMNVRIRTKILGMDAQKIAE